MDKLLEKIVANELPDKAYELRRAAFTGTADVAGICADFVATVGDRYFRTRNRSRGGKNLYGFSDYVSVLEGEGYLPGPDGMIMIHAMPVEILLASRDSVPMLCVTCPNSSAGVVDITVSPKTFTRHLRMFLDSLGDIKGAFDELWFGIKKRGDIAAIERPYLEQRLAETLGIKGIDYVLSRRVNGNVLAVRIVEELWMEGPLSTANVERVTEFAPYFIHRPERLATEMPEYRIVRRYGLNR